MKLLTIITVTYNCEELIGLTLSGILAHKPDELEYIIVDGASTDGTLKKTEQYSSDIDLLITEPDSGIYDAMNKGLAAASGEYVLFINAGDSLYDHQVLPALLDRLREGRYDIYYGDTMLVDGSYNEIGLRSTHSSRALPAAMNWKSLRRGMVVSHQSFIVRRSIAPAYDLRYRSSSDVDWVIRCLKKANGVQHTGITISKYLTGGHSKQQHPLSLRERYDILRRHYGFLSNLFNHLIILLRGAWFRIRGKALN
jgi:glycosyltransferase involved in cell wall biosynthesis